MAQTPAKLVTADELLLYRRTKAIFAACRNSLSNCKILESFREEDLKVERHRKQKSNHAKQGLAAYVHYYNNYRLHTDNNSMSPVNYQMSTLKESGTG